MLKLRDSFIRSLFNKKIEWKNINEDQYINSDCSEEKLYKKMFPTEKELKKFYEYRKEWFTRGSELVSGEKPLSINCELVSTCNLACTMCYTISEKFQNSVVGAQRMMPWKFVKQIINETAENDIPSISFSWRGESTLYRDQDENGKIITFPDVLKYAREKNILEITCLTHGQLIDDAMAKGIVEAEPTWINFSIDGLKDEYNKIRTPPNKTKCNYDAFEEVSNSIKLISKYKKELNKNRPIIRTNTIFPAVKDTFKKYCSYFKSIGVEMITVNEILDYRHVKAPEELIRKNWHCQYPFQRLTISSNGIIIPCTGAVNEEKELVLGKLQGSENKKIRNYKGEIVENDLKNLTIMNAWKSSKLEKIRFLHKNNRRTEIEPGCRNCHHGHIKEGYGKIPESWDSEKLKWSKHSSISTKPRYRTRAISK